jgi:hypothetical protein
MMTFTNQSTLLTVFADIHKHATALIAFQKKKPKHRSIPPISAGFRVVLSPRRKEEEKSFRENSAGSVITGASR